jgi:predicted dehydrogenase
MSDNLNDKKVLLIGAGSIAIDYVKILNHLSIQYTVVGRSAAGVEAFEKQSSVVAIAGGLQRLKKEEISGFDYAIVAVNVEELADTAISLMDFGIKKILLEKPGGIDANAIYTISRKAKDTNSNIIVAYNRRFYASVLRAQEMIKEDGGVRSFHFDFTEWVHAITDIIRNDEVKRNWFLANSTHVVDMAFFLGGKPQKMTTYKKGGFDWHPSGSIFSGAGVSESGALFSYRSNWEAPGRWGVQVETDFHKLIFKPLEKLQIQNHKSVAIEFVDIEDHLDIEYKPGLFKQVENFLTETPHPNFIDIHQHYNACSTYYQQILHPEI